MWFKTVFLVILRVLQGGAPSMLGSEAPEADSGGPGAGSGGVQLRFKDSMLEL